MTRTPVDRRTALGCLGTAAAVVAAGCAGGGSSGVRTVGMADGFAFDPDAITVGAGRTVRWENGSGIGHTVTAYGDRIPEGAAYFASGGFDSERAARNDVSGGLVAPGEAFEHTFERPGTYDYYCIPHESSGMVGRVRVD